MRRAERSEKVDQSVSFSRILVAFADLDTLPSTDVTFPAATYPCTR